MEGTARCPANYIPLTPISFLERAAVVYPDHPAVVYGSTVYTWKETRERCHKLAAALADDLGICRGDVVAALAPNVPAMYELHFGVPMAGAVLCSLNTRYDSAMLSMILKLLEAKVIFVDTQFLETFNEALKFLSGTKSKMPHLVVISESSNTSGYLEYEELLKTTNPNFQIRWPADECDPISINYTSGTTSTPKGVVYSHRGAYLNAISTILLNDMTTKPVYLWTVPMFHCNGWCLPWGVAAQGGTNICVREASAEAIFDQIVQHKVTHMGGAPTVLNMIANAPFARQKPLPGKVIIMTGGAPPPPAVLLKMEELGFHVIHCYGMTETYGAASSCTWKPQWNDLPSQDRAKMKSRQGLRHMTMEELDIKDPISMESVPADAETIGEVMVRGNTVMNGYYKDAKATDAAFAGGWFRTGDLGIRHPDGYMEFVDRSRDIIISGGENISTVVVESLLFSHPAVLEAAVVAKPGEHSRMTPCAFVTLKAGMQATSEEIMDFCRTKLPHYMVPTTVVFADLPKTSTGKIQKFVLRKRAESMSSISRLTNQ